MRINKVICAGLYHFYWECPNIASGEMYRNIWDFGQGGKIASSRHIVATTHARLVKYAVCRLLIFLY